MSHIAIQVMKREDVSQCEGIPRSLPDWFGIESAIVDYVRDLQEMETWVARDGETIIGFLTLKRHGDVSAEIQVIAVTKSLHGRGCGRKLLEEAERVLRARSVEFLQVKTLGPTRESVHYKRTRGFYSRMGFTPLEENNLWGETNPCLIMVKHLKCPDNLS